MQIPQMPVLDGYNATRAIRKHTDPDIKDILVIAMTASAIRGDREKCLEAGMNNYLAKPVRADTLEQMLESYLNQPERAIPNLQEETNSLVSRTLSHERSAAGESRVDGDTDAAEAKRNRLVVTRSEDLRPKSPAKAETTIRLAPAEMVQKAAQEELPTANRLKESARPPQIKRISSMGKGGQSNGAG